MRIANLVFGALFAISALLQLNDPDPWRWVAMWGAAAAACFLHRRLIWLPPLVAIVALVWAVSMAPYTLPELQLGDLANEMKAETPSIEHGREMLGLLIMGGWTAALSWQTWVGRGEQG